MGKNKKLSYKGIPSDRYKKIDGIRKPSFKNHNGNTRFRQNESMHAKIIG